MLRFTFTLIASLAAAARTVFAATSSAAPGARRFRRVVAATLLLTILIPFVPPGHAHAEEDEHEVGDVPAIEAKAASGVDGAAAVQGGCPPYISGGPNNPASGVRIVGVCVDVPVWLPFIGSWVSCEICSCWYEMDDGSRMPFSTSSGCSSTIRIQGPAPDPCNTLNQC